MQGRWRGAAAVAVLLAAICLVVVTARVHSVQSRHGTSDAVDDGRFRLPAGGQSLVVFGDSWTEGVAASPRTQGFAFLVGRELGTPTRVLGAGGTGYVTRGPSGAPDFPTRMRQLDVDPRVGLLIVQGGINDLARPDGVGRAAAQVVEAARVTYPEARVVVIGPIPPTPASTGALRPMSSEIARSLAGSGALYVSPIDEGWITTTSSRGFLDARTNHPTTAGHRLLASRMVADLRRLSATPTYPVPPATS